MTNPTYYDKPKKLGQPPNIMTNSNSYDSHNYYDYEDMVSPNYGHHDCTILNPLYKLNCKHRTRTIPIYV